MEAHISCNGGLRGHPLFAARHFHRYSLSLQTKPSPHCHCQSSSSSNQRVSKEVRRISYEKHDTVLKVPDSGRTANRVEVPAEKIGREFFFPSYPLSYLESKGLWDSTQYYSDVWELIRKAQTRPHCNYVLPPIKNPPHYKDVLAEYRHSYEFEFMSAGLNGRASIEKGDPIDVVSLFPDHHIQKTSEDDGHFLVRINNGVVVSYVGLNDSCLINNKGRKRKRYILVFCFWVPTFWNDDHDAWDIVKATSELKKSRYADDFEMVVVVKMRSKWADDADAFDHFFSAFPDCLAVPFENKLARDRICDLLLCGGKPTSLIVDTVDEKVLQYGTCDEFWGSYGADAFPFTDERLQTLQAQRLQLRDLKQGISLKELLSPSTHLSNFMDKNMEIPIELLNDKLVGLYLCSNCSGKVTHTLSEIREHCRDGLEFKIVVVHAPFNICRDPTLLQQNLGKKLGREELEDWWVLWPYTDSISRRLWNVFGLLGGDKLILVGPNGEFLDPYGGEVLQHRDFGGVNAFPFTRERAIEREAKRLRAISLDQVLVSGPSLNYVLRGMSENSDRVPVAMLQDKVVLVYFCTLRQHDEGDHMEEHHHPDLELLKELYPWFVSLKEEHPDDLEIVLFAVGWNPSKLSCGHCKGWMSKIPWLVCPFDYDHWKTVVERIFRGKDVSWYKYGDGIMAFGKDGYLCSTNADALLLSRGSGAFPFSGDVREEVRGHLIKELPFFGE